MAEFIAAEDHWNALREQEGGDEISLLALAEDVDSAIIGRTFGSAIPGIVVIGAVAIFLAVGFVVFFVVADKILKSEAVVGGDEVDAGIGLSAAVLVKIAAAGETGGEILHETAVTFPESAD